MESEDTLVDVVSVSISNGSCLELVKISKGKLSEGKKTHTTSLYYL